ncbi:MAG: hypothetical protein GC185_09615 [Alphaproteobacteria bacterium]|nr:hypothetical protein [Alphaproteobacteria bacterium]
MSEARTRPAPKAPRLFRRGFRAGAVLSLCLTLAFSPARADEKKAAPPLNDFASAIAEGMGKGSAAREYYQALEFIRGRGHARNLQKALTLLNDAADGGYLRAQVLLGAMYMDDNIPAPIHDDAKAVRWLQKAHAQDEKDPSALYHLAMLYGDGRGGLQKDMTKKIAFLKTAAEAGFPLAQHALGSLYLTGDGVSQDEKKAEEWLKKSAAQGVAESQYNLGYMYRQGVNGEKDMPLALDWLKKSAKNGFSGAQLMLGQIYRDGDGVKKDEKQAALWLRKAAVQNVAEAQWALADLYDHGRGVAQDHEKSYFWQSLAQANGKSGVLVKTVLWLSRAGLEDDKLKAAQQAIQNWKATHVIPPEMLE